MEIKPYQLLNIGYICTDYQVEQGRGDKIAFKFLNKESHLTEITYKELTLLSNKAANLLQDLGFAKGDRVMLLLSRTPDMYAFFLGALKLGLNVSILFTSIGEDSIIDRVLLTKTKAIISSSQMVFRLAKILPKLSPSFRVLLIDQSVVNGALIGVMDRFLGQGEDFRTEPSTPEQFSHFHFTSGSTGKPKGVQHQHGAIVDIVRSMEEVIQPEPNDLYWCTADPGWVTGTSYGIIAPLACGLSQILLESNYDLALWMEIIEKYRVNLLYTAPTVLRLMAQEPVEYFLQFDLASLKRVYTVGEPLDPNLVYWGRKVFGCELHDTWFQTETGSVMIANRPGIEVRPGSMGKPLEYIQAAILSDDEKPKEAKQKGLLCVKTPWSSMFREYIGNPKEYRKKFIGSYYTSGDLAFTDEDGYYWFIGRNDEVINTAGHLVSPYEIESAIMEVPNVLDCAVVGLPDDLLYEKVIAFVKANLDLGNRNKLGLSIKLHVSKKIASLASPKEVVFVESIPKTKSGKVMRRVLKNQHIGLDLGDLSTLEE